MGEPTTAITTVTVRIPVTPAVGLRRTRRPPNAEPPEVTIEIWRDVLRVWDSVNYTDCGTSYRLGRLDSFAAQIASDNTVLTDIPYFPTVFKAVSEQYAVNRSNPLGAFLQLAVEAMETALAAKEGTCVYFAGCGGRVKIGWSGKVASRLAKLQTGNPEPIRLLGLVPGGRLRERQLHQMFASARLSGEWFSATPELMAYIAESGLA